MSEHPTPSRRLAICLINPRSKPSYWTFDYAMPFFNLGRKPQYSMANGSLVAVAALVPAQHEVVIIDENIERLDFESLRRFDVIGVTGMIVQSDRMQEILLKLRSLPATIVAGGPLVTVSETTFEALCDVLENQLSPPAGARHHAQPSLAEVGTQQLVNLGGRRRLRHGFDGSLRPCRTTQPIWTWRAGSPTRPTRSRAGATVRRTSSSRQSPT